MSDGAGSRWWLLSSSSAASSDSVSSSSANTPRPPFRSTDEGRGVGSGRSKLKPEKGASSLASKRCETAVQRSASSKVDQGNGDVMPNELLEAELTVKDDGRFEEAADVHVADCGREEQVDMSSSSSSKDGRTISPLLAVDTGAGGGVTPPVSLSRARRRDSSFSLSLGSNLRREPVVGAFERRSVEAGMVGDEAADALFRLGEGKPKEVGRPPSLRLGREIDSDRLWEWRFRCGWGEVDLLSSDERSRGTGNAAEDDMRRAESGRRGTKGAENECEVMCVLSRSENDGGRRRPFICCGALEPKLNEDRRLMAASSSSSWLFSLSSSLPGRQLA